MTTVTALECALAEMSFELAESEFQGEHAVSIPAQFSCDPSATIDADALEAAFEDKNVGVFVEFVRTPSPDRAICNFEVYDAEDYSKTSVKAWPDAVRIYPGEGGLTKTALAEITNAIETAFETALTHDPIDRDWNR